MDKAEIYNILDSKLASSDLQLLDFLKKQIKELYASFGKHDSMTLEQINANVDFMARKMNESIKADARMKSLRTAEIKYLFNQGLMGRLDSKYKSLSLQMLYSWLQEYLSSAERRGAMSDWIAAKAMDLPGSDVSDKPPVESDEWYWQWIESSYNNYLKQREIIAKQFRPTMLSSGATFAEKDHGGCQKRFLVKRGYMRECESFKEFLDRAMSNEGIFLPVN